MTHFLKLFIIFFVFLLFGLTAFAKKIDYVFDPKDPHHSIYIPESTSQSPAILLLHARTGIEKVNYDWANRLKNHGYVVFMIDSYKPRGWEDHRLVDWDQATQAQFHDIAPAYEYLSQLPYVDSKRIGVLGFAMGGFNVFRVMGTMKNNRQTGQAIPFKAAASFYGVCHRLEEGVKIQGVNRIFIGSKDDRGTIEDCKNLVNRSQTNNDKITMQIYPDALHGFDNFEFPVSKEVIDEKGEVYHVGFNEDARRQSLADLPAFFDDFLKGD